MNLELQDIFTQFGSKYRQNHSLPLHQLKTMKAIEACRTSILGAHVDVCDHCCYERISYNSCRNRHCPKCQGLAKEQWLLERERDLLEIGYFHVVFTVPDSLHHLALQVTFFWRDYKDNNRTKLMTLDISEFIRRFLLHVLPSRFVKIRHYGILSNRNRSTKLRLCQRLTLSKIRESQKLSTIDLLFKLTGIDLMVCPCCGQRTMVHKTNFGLKFAT